MSEPAQTPPKEKELMMAALELPSDERAAFLAEACGSEPSLKVLVLELLKNAETDGAFMARPAVDLGATTAMNSVTVGGQVGRYKLLEQIGEGGMGVVFVAEQLEPVRRKVALKVIKPGMDSKQVIARFEAERQALALMDHENIARVHDGGTTEQGLPYFVMELVRGLSITQYCDQAKSSTRRRLELFMNVCSAVQHAHQKGIIHRDIKPSNVMITLHDGQPVVKVIDFGVSKALHQQLSQQTIYTALNQVVGTPLYMSPEQMELSGLDIDTRTDVYSLGVLLYELLIGETPFSRERLMKSDFDEMRRIIREEEPQRPSYRITTLPKAELSTVANKRGLDERSFSKSVQGELDWITLKALEKDRNRRFESASAFRADIQRYLNDEPVLACPPSTWYRLSKLFRRHRVLVGTSTLVFAALLLGLVGTSIQTDRAWKAEALAQERFENERVARTKANVERDRADHERQRADKETERAQQEKAKAQQESSRAQEEAAVASEISNFLQKDLLAQIDVNNQFANANTADQDIKLSTLLDRASDRIEGRFDGMPAVEGSLRYTIAQCYCSLGNYDKATHHVELAVAIGRNVIGFRHPGTLRAICLQGNLLQLRDDFDSAERLLLEAQQGIIANGDEASEDGRVVLSELLVLRFRQGYHEEAKKIALKLLEICQQELGLEAPETLTTMANLAIQHSALGDDKTAETLDRDVYEARLRILGPKHPDTLASMRSLAVHYDRQGQYEQSQQLFEQLVEGLTELLGEDHPDTLHAKSNLGHVLTRRSQLVEAEALLLDTVAKLTIGMGEKHSMTLVALGRLSSVYEFQNRWKECLGLRERVVEGLRAQLGDVHPDVISARANLASILRILKRTSEADLELQQAISDARTTMGDQHPLTLMMLNNLAVSFYDAKKYEDALVLFQELEQTRVALNGPDSLGVLSAQVNIASVIRFLGREKESRELLSDAISRLDRVYGENHPLALVTRQKLAEHYESDESLGDRLIQAELLYRNIFESNERSHGLQHPSTLAVARLLVSNLVKQGRVPEAIEFCQRKIDIASTNWGASDSQTLQLIGSLGLAMQIAGQFHEAEKLFRQAYLHSQSLNPEDPLKSRAISSLVSCLNLEMRYEESKLLLEARISELQAAPGDQLNAILKVQALLAKTIEQIGSTLEPDPNLPKSELVDEKS